MAIGLKIKHSTGEITTGTGDLTLNAAGNLVLDYATFPSTDGTSGQILKTDGAGNLSWAADSGGPANTDALPEGSSNLYYTDARADARITNAGSANWDTAFGWGDHGAAGYLTSIAVNSINDTHIDWGTGANQVSTADIPEQTNLYYTDARADARITNAGSANWNTAYGWGDHASGGYLTSVGALTSHTDVTITTPSSGQHLTYNGSAWVNSTVSAASAAGSDTYVQFNDGGNMGADAGLTYAKATDTLTAGTFTTSGASPTLTAAGALAITTTASNGSITITPHGSGDIILDGQKWPQADGSANQILKTDGAGQLSWTADAGGMANIVEDTTPQLGGTLDANGNIIDMGSNNITDAKVGQWDTAYTHSQAAHAPAGAEVNQNAFTTIAISGQTDVVADAKTDTLTLVAGSNVTLTTNAGADSITIASSGGGVSDFVSLTDTPANYSGSAADFVKVNSSGNALIFVADPGYITSTGVLSSHTDVHNAAPTDGQVLTWVNANSRWEPAAGGGGGSQDVFKTIAVSGQSDVVADSTTDTLTLAAGSNMTITTNAGSDTITFASSGGGGSSSETFTVNYAAGGTSISSISGLPAGWSSSINGNNVTITHTAGGQPMGVSFYGLDKSASPDVWKYGYPTSTYPLTFPDTGAGEVISTTEFTLNVGTAATGANTGTPFATSLAHIKVIF